MKEGGISFIEINQTAAGILAVRELPGEHEVCALLPGQLRIEARCSIASLSGQWNA